MLKILVYNIGLRPITCWETDRLILMKFGIENHVRAVYQPTKINFVALFNCKVFFYRLMPDKVCVQRVLRLLHKTQIWPLTFVASNLLAVGSWGNAASELCVARSLSLRWASCRKQDERLSNQSYRPVAETHDLRSKKIALDDLKMRFQGRQSENLLYLFKSARATHRA